MLKKKKKEKIENTKNTKNTKEQIDFLNEVTKLVSILNTEEIEFRWVSYKDELAIAVDYESERNQKILNDQKIKQTLTYFERKNNVPILRGDRLEMSNTSSEVKFKQWKDLTFENKKN